MWKEKLRARGVVVKEMDNIDAYSKLLQRERERVKKESWGDLPQVMPFEFLSSPSLTPPSTSP